MKPTKLRLIITAAVFAAWIGYLAYVVADLCQQPRETIEVQGKEREVPVVLSRPQFLVASLVVTAEVQFVGSRIDIERLLKKARELELRDRHKQGMPLEAVRMRVEAEFIGKHLATEAKVLNVHWPINDETGKLEGQTIEVDNLADSQGLPGAGSYILPLLHGPDGYKVAPTPPSPGYPPATSKPGEPGPPRIYPNTPHTREQLEEIRRKLQVP